MELLATKNESLESCDAMGQTLNKQTSVLERSSKKKTGSFYTPEYLAKMISDETLFNWIAKQVDKHVDDLDELSLLSKDERSQLLERAKRIRILDPSVGEGVFLLSAADRLVDILISLGEKASEKSLRKLIATKCLFGVDFAEHAVKTSRLKIGGWGDIDNVTNIRYGNSLVGFVHASMNMNPDSKLIKGAFHWSHEFPKVFCGLNEGFDIVLGNPPYGNILGNQEREFIKFRYPFNLGGTRAGTWNSAAHFISRALSLLKEGGQLGFLVPNSILRVKQFSKTREFLLDKTKLHKIVDEGSPFENVTLEMVSLFCEKEKATSSEVQIESRRPGLEQSNLVDISVLKNSKIFPIYHDHIFERVLERGLKQVLIANRGRDIPKNHIRRSVEPGFSTPYITSGRSVRRYHLNERFIVFTDDWYQDDAALRKSYENEFLVATKNLRYPRCIIKPRGIVHGGGIVKITPLLDSVDLRALGLILNSKLVRLICIRYLTNYSQLTCCLNTGIMEALPVVLPKNPSLYSALFDSFTMMYSDGNKYSPKKTKLGLERISDALVYSLYFDESSELELLLEDRVAELEDPNGVTKLTEDQRILSLTKQVLDEPIVREIEHLGNYPPSDKTLRY